MTVNLEARDKIVLSVSVERVINTTLDLLEQHIADGSGDLEVAEVNLDDWYALRATVVTLWQEAREAAMQRKLAGEG